MITFLKFAFLSVVLYSLTNKDCGLLSNGNYKFIQSVSSSDAKTKIVTETRVSIADSNFTQYWSSGDSANGKIAWIDDCTFKLIYLNKKTAETNELKKIILDSFGDPCFELKEKRGRKIKFRTTYSGNLHVTTSEGVIIKIR